MQLHNMLNIHLGASHTVAASAASPVLGSWGCGSNFISSVTWREINWLKNVVSFSLDRQGNVISRNSVRDVVEEKEENRPAILPAVPSYTKWNITFESGRNNHFQPAFSLEFHIFWKISILTLNSRDLQSKSLSALSSCN